MENFYRRIRRMGKFLVTRKRDGGARYFVTNATKRGPVLMSSDSTGLKASEDLFVFYKSNYDSEYFSFSINTLLGSENNSSFTVPLTLYTPNYDITIVWGDNSSTDIKSGTQLTEELLTHTYKDGGTYSLKILSPSGVMPVFKPSMFGDNKLKIVSLDSPLLKFDTNCPNYNNLSHFADGAINLTSLPSKLLMHNSFVTNYDYFVYGATSLTELPSDLLNYATKQSSFQYFAANTNITTIPEDLFSITNPSDLSYAFYNCTNLSSYIDVDKLFGDRPLVGVDVSYMFYNCTLTDGDAKSFETKVSKYVPYLFGNGEFITGIESLPSLTGTIYPTTIKDDNGNVVMDLIPIKSGDYCNGKLAQQNCLYDTVSDVLLYPNGGEFTYNYSLDTDNNVSNNMPDSFKENALYGCSKWSMYYDLDTIWTGFPQESDNVVYVDGTDWLTVNDYNFFSTL